MKTLNEYCKKSALNEASMLAMDEKALKKLPAFSKSQAENLKHASKHAGWKALTKKASALGCKVEYGYIIVEMMDGRAGYSGDLRITAPDSALTSFWFQTGTKSALFKMPEDFMELSMYACIQPELKGKNLETAVEEVKKAAAFVKWFNEQGAMKLLPMFNGVA